MTKSKKLITQLALMMTAILVSMVGTAWAELPLDQEPIRYRQSIAVDPIAKLQTKLDKGEVKLAFDKQKASYLKAVLAALKIPEESQTLVFSKTSFQHTRIAPKTPRALYFNDEVYIGWVQGGDVLEIASMDPQLGAVFYLLDDQKADKPEFQRQTDLCIQCHVSGKTRDVPGLMLRSVYTDRIGYPVYNAGAFVTDQTSPLKERWGGWYVTGTHGDQRHMGNVMVSSHIHPERLDFEVGSNKTSLKGLVDTYAYLTPHSDIVALMVMEHQSQMHNLITFANYQTRLGRHYDSGMNKAFGEPSDRLTDSTKGRIKDGAEKLVTYMLFSEETKLTSPIEGSTAYAKKFASSGPRDRKGRSLRDLDLKTRLFRYPCSYLIYSEAFDGLPPLMKAEVYKRLGDVLSGKDQRPEYAHLSANDRQAIMEILIDTKPDLPTDWKIPHGSPTKGE
jgi:hypothetical protein